MAMRSGGQLVVEALAREGVSRIFSLSGGVLNPIYDACLEAGVEIVHARHEGGAGFMADGWARATRQPGVCVVTLGPGVTNTITPMLTALEGGSPLLVIAGQAPVELAGLPTLTARMGRGSLGREHELYFGLASIADNEVARFALRECDLL